MTKDINHANRNIHIVQESLELYFLLIIFFCRILLSRFLGDEGMCYFAGPFELYMMAMIAYSFSKSDVVALLMKARIKREQYKNSLTVFHTSFSCSIGFSVLYALVCILGVQFICTNIFLCTYSWMTLLMILPAIICAFVCAPIKGFFNAINQYGIVVIGQLLMIILSVIGLFLGAVLGIRYGTDIANLLFNDSILYCYASGFAAAGFSIAQIIVLIYYIVFYLLLGRELKSVAVSDTMKRTETVSQILPIIYSNFSVKFLQLLFLQLIVLIGQNIFIKYNNETEQAHQSLAFWGCYYGKYLPVVGIVIVICILPLMPQINGVLRSYLKEDRRATKDRFEKLIQRFILNAIPCAILISILAPYVIRVCFKGMTTSIIQVMQCGTILIIACIALYVFKQLLYKLQENKIMLVIHTIGFIVFLFGASIAIKVTNSGLLGIMIAMSISFILQGIGLFFIVKHIWGCRVNYFVSILLPLLCASISGLIILLFTHFFDGKLADYMMLLLGAGFGYVIYMILLLTLKVVSSNQVQSMRFGNIWLSIARQLGIY